MDIRRKMYWQRWKGYKRLDGSSETGRVKVKRVKMDPYSTRKRRFWRIKIVPKLRILKTASPKRLLVWLRDAYVKMMLRLANSRVIGASGHVGSGFGSGPVLKEYDEKMLVEIYKSILMAQGNLMHRDTPKLASDLVRPVVR
ncbi:PREDICTED: uncharacterized protein LOC104817473 [Tarenaya hassleriana]|uniref:uncharacterized protein LOC104817473 n=1 Tax=Tarenaya hassleriana TaxID=28532 RepID=UPI00053C98EF|nr:PREDICTED: uncharacterized protein LOC104817473 [Tarenaya hassleriana]